MSSILKPNKATAIARLQALIAGTLKQFPSGSFTLGSTAYTTASLVQALRDHEDAIAAANAAQVSAKDALYALRASETKVAPLLRDYQTFLRAAFNNTAATLAEFGMQPPKARAPLTGEKRAVATAKLRATRVARGTTSRKQKLAIKGNVTGVQVTPITEPPAPHA